MCIVDKNIINIASQCLNCKTHPCNSLCTLKMPINKILNFVKQNKLEEAAKLIYSYSCFPFVCGALCNHEKKCEGSCALSNKQNGVKYHEVEYELGKAYINELYKKKNENTNHKVAIIGGGICGMEGGKLAAHYQKIHQPNDASRKEILLCDMRNPFWENYKQQNKC